MIDHDRDEPTNASTFAEKSAQKVQQWKQADMLLPLPLPNIDCGDATHQFITFAEKKVEKLQWK